MKDRYPSEAAERFQIRMPNGLRDRIRSAAEANARSMNSEIVHRLEQSFVSEGGMKSIVEGWPPADRVEPEEAVEFARTRLRHALAVLEFSDEKAKD